tara:strand:- start:374 stop:1075 length:702 start_codon:yes stop_codon:yes gene_type:complete
MFPVVILSGGLATRLGRKAKYIPKSLIQIAGKPFIFHQLNYLVEQGIKDVHICIGHLGEMIKDKVGTGKQFNLNITYSDDGPKLLGTGGAIKNSLSYLPQDFFILYGDSYLPINFSDVLNGYLRSKKSGLITVLKNNDKWDKSNVIYNNNKVIMYNKDLFLKDMNYIDYGLSVMSSSLFSEYRQENFDLGDVFYDLSIKDELAGFEVSQRFYEIGSQDGINDTENFLLNGGVE